MFATRIEEWHIHETKKKIEKTVNENRTEQELRKEVQNEIQAMRHAFTEQVWGQSDMWTISSLEKGHEKGISGRFRTDIYTSNAAGQSGHGKQTHFDNIEYL